MGSLVDAQIATALRHGLISTILGLRNGLHYGVKIRAPHALVMTMIFKNDSPLKSNLISIIKMTFVHARNLGAFVLIYKALIALGRTLHLASGQKLVTPPGAAAIGWHALLAGWIGGQMVWAKHSSVNEQIALYLLSRTIIGLVKVLAKKGVKPFCNVTYTQAYPFLAASVWAIVMWLYEVHPKTLQASLETSMRYLYTDTNYWRPDMRELLPSVASAAVVAITCALHRKDLSKLWDLSARL